MLECSPDTVRCGCGTVRLVGMEMASLAAIDRDVGRGRTTVASSGGSCFMLGGVWVPLPLPGPLPPPPPLVSNSSICRPEREES